MIYSNQVKGSKKNKKERLTSDQTFQSLKHQNKFSLTIDIFYYIHFFRKVNVKSQNENCKAVMYGQILWQAENQYLQSGLSKNVTVREQPLLSCGGHSKT